MFDFRVSIRQKSPPGSKAGNMTPNLNWLPIMIQNCHFPAGQPWEFHSGEKDIVTEYWLLISKISIYYYTDRLDI